MKSAAMGNLVACPHKVCNYVLNAKRTSLQESLRIPVLERKVFLLHYLDKFRQEKAKSRDSETSLKKLRSGQGALSTLAHPDPMKSERVLQVRR